MNGHGERGYSEPHGEHCVYRLICHCVFWGVLFIAFWDNVPTETGTNLAR